MRRYVCTLRHAHCDDLVEFIDALPRNAMNKIERAKLKQRAADWKL